MKKGFVLLETIIVITVLCVILITLYGAYSKVLIGVNKKSLYDNTEYIYKTNIIREYLENNWPEAFYMGRNFTIYCSNSDSSKKCYTNTPSDDKGKLLKSLGAEAVYITMWNVDEVSKADLTNLKVEATTQNYIKSLDYVPEDSVFRIIVMFNDENNKSDRKVYQYASLRFRNRG